MLPVPKPIAGTAFFPGGYGLIAPEVGSLPAFPHRGTMVVGHDFHSEAGYNASFARNYESPTQPTWRNMLALLDDAGISRGSCFFTNFFLGLRAGTATTGSFPGATASFVKQCRDFFVRQLEVQQPTLILTLGIHTPYFLAPLSPDLADWGTRRGLKHLDTAGPLKFTVRFPALPSYTATVVALTHPSLRHASVRHRRYGALAGAGAELAMLREALGQASAPSV